jgi:hypothetical protein
MRGRQARWRRAKQNCNFAFQYTVDWFGHITYAQEFRLGLHSGENKYETTPAEAQAEWEPDQAEKAGLAKSKRGKQRASRNVIPEGVKTRW